MRSNRPIVLGIETSCDETAVAIVGADKTIYAHHLLSQIDDHAVFGGVVPEIAARSHITHLDQLIEAALLDASMDIDDMDAIAATAGPGLVGGLMVGVMTAKALAKVAGKPFFAINHLEGHALAVRLTDDVAFPFLLLLVSGGHCQLLEVKGVGSYARLGSTLDDAVGEAYDKIAKLLGLAYPGGPAVEVAARTGDAARFTLPRPLIDQDTLNFSFSGLKSAVRREAELCVEERGALQSDDVSDLCAGFQAAVVECLCDRSAKAMRVFQKNNPSVKAPYFVVSGGVASNAAIRESLKNKAENAGFTMVAPPLEFCTDNGAMIAWAGVERYLVGGDDDSQATVLPRWPLDDLAPPLYGFGKKGAKA